MTDPRIADLEQQVENLQAALDNEKHRYAEDATERSVDARIAARFAEMARPYLAFSKDVVLLSQWHARAMQEYGDQRAAMATREIWAAIRKAVDEPMDLPIDGGEWPSSYRRGRHETVDLIRSMAEAELRADPVVRSAPAPLPENPAALLAALENERRRYGEAIQQRDDYRSDYLRVHKDKCDALDEIQKMRATTEQAIADLIARIERLEDAAARWEAIRRAGASVL
jgi:hypothetical protein